MIAPLLARLALVILVAPFLFLFCAIAFALAASQAGEYVATAVLAVALLGMLLAIDRWLGAVTASFGPRDDAAGITVRPDAVRPAAARPGYDN